MEKESVTNTIEPSTDAVHSDKHSPDKAHPRLFDTSKVLADLERSISSITEQSVVEILEGMWDKVRGFNGIAGFKGILAQLTIKSMGWSMTVFDKLGIGVNDPDRALKASETYLTMVSAYKAGRHAADNSLELPEVKESDEPTKNTAIAQIMIEHLLVDRQHLRRMTRIESTVADVIEQLTTITPDDNAALSEWKQKLSNQLQKKYSKKYPQQVIHEIFESETWKMIFPEHEELPQLLSTVPARLISRKLLNYMLSANDSDSIPIETDKTTSQDILQLCKNVEVPVKILMEKIIPEISTNLQLRGLLTQLYEKEKGSDSAVKRFCKSIVNFTKGISQNKISVEAVLREVNKLVGDITQIDEQKVSIALQMVAIVYKKAPHLFPGIATNPLAVRIVTEALLQDNDRTHEFFESTTDLTVKDGWDKEKTGIVQIKEQLSSNLVIITNGQAYKIPSYVVVDENGAVLEIVEDDLIKYQNFRILSNGQIELSLVTPKGHHTKETLSQKIIFTPISSAMNYHCCAEILQIFSKPQPDTSSTKFEFGTEFVDALKLYDHLSSDDRKIIDQTLENTLGIISLDGFDEFCFDLETSNPSVPVVLMWDRDLQKLRASYNHLVQDGILGALAANHLKKSIEENLLSRMEIVADLSPLPTIEQPPTKSQNIFKRIMRFPGSKRKKETIALYEKLTARFISINTLIEGNIAPSEGVGRIKLNKSKFRNLVLAINIFAGKDIFADVTTLTLFSYLGGLLRASSETDIFNGWKATNNLAECAQRTCSENMDALDLSAQIRESLAWDKFIIDISKAWNIKPPRVGTDDERNSGDRREALNSLTKKLSEGQQLTEQGIVKLLAKSAYYLTSFENLIEAYLKLSIPLADTPLAGSATAKTGRIIPVVIRELKFPDVKGWLERIQTLLENPDIKESRDEINNLKTATARSMRATSKLFQLGLKYAGKGDWVSQAALHVVSNLGKLGVVVKKIAMSEVTGKVAKIVAATVGTQSNTVHPIDTLWTSRLVEQEAVTPVQMSMSKNTDVDDPQNVITLRLSMPRLKEAAPFAKSYIKAQLLLSHAQKLWITGEGDVKKVQKGLTEFAQLIDSQKGRRILSSLAYRFLMNLSNGITETALKLMQKDFEIMCGIFIPSETTPPRDNTLHEPDTIINKE